MSALAVEVLFSNPCAYLTESETLEKSKGYRHSRVSALLPGINLMSHFTCSRPEKSPISSCQRRLASTRLHQKPRREREKLAIEGWIPAFAGMTRAGIRRSLYFQVVHSKKSKKSCAFKGLRSFMKNIPDSSALTHGMTIFTTANADTSCFRCFKPSNLPEHLFNLMAQK